MAGVLLEYFAGAKLSKRLDPAPNRWAVLMQCFFRTNTLLMALPLAAALFDDISVISIVFAFVIPLYNILAVIAFEQDRGSKVNPFGSIIKNPLLIATVLGLLANFTHLRLPDPVSNVMNTLATVGNGLPLMVLGANFDFSHAVTQKRLITLSCIIRLIIQPVIFVLLGVFLFHFKNIDLLAILAVFGCGVPTTTFTMAKEMAGDAELAGEIVVFSNLFSCLTHSCGSSR